MPSLANTRHARRRDADDDVGLRIRLFRQQLGGDDAGRIAHELDLDVRVGLVERLLVGLDLVGLERGVDEQLGLLRGGGPRDQHGTAATTAADAIGLPASDAWWCVSSMSLLRIEGRGQTQRHAESRRDIGVRRDATRRTLRRVQRAATPSGADGIRSRIGQLADC